MKLIRGDMFSDIAANFPLEHQASADGPTSAFLLSGSLTLVAIAGVPAGLEPPQEILAMEAY
jgi:hypothetical protein